MPFLGNRPAENYISYDVQHFTTSATTNYTLDHAVANENELRLVINNVVQQPGSSYAYSASGTSLTLTSATSATDTMYCVYLGKAVQTVTPATGTVTGAMMNYPLTNFSSTGIDDNSDATAITINNSEQVGIGTTSPDRELTVGGVANARIGILSTDNSSGASQLHFGDTDNSQIGRVYYDHSDNSMRLHTNNSEAMRIHSDGTVFVGSSSTTIPANATSGTYATIGGGFPLQSTNNNICAIFNRHSSTGVIIEFKYNGSVKGLISTNGSTTAYNTSSDYRLKENIADITDATTRVKQLQPKRFNFIENADTTVDGFIAHEVSSIVPEAITGEKDAVDENGDIAPQGIDQSKLVPVLTKALQEAITKIEELETRIQTLENN